MHEGMKTAKTTVFEMESLVVIGKCMRQRNINFSKAVNFLLKQGDYLLRKIEIMKEEELKKHVEQPTEKA